MLRKKNGLLLNQKQSDNLDFNKNISFSHIDLSKPESKSYVALVIKSFQILPDVLARMRFVKYLVLSNSKRTFHSPNKTGSYFIKLIK